MNNRNKNNKGQRLDLERLFALLNRQSKKQKLPEFRREWLSGEPKIKVEPISGSPKSGLFASKIGLTLSAIVLFSTAVYISTHMFKESRKPLRAMVLDAEGEVALKRERDKTWQKINRGDIIYTNDKIKTAEDAKLSIIFTGDTAVHLKENSQVKLEEFSKTASKKIVIKLALLKGKTLCLNNGGASEEVVEITTPAAVVGVPNGMYEVSISQDGKTTVHSIGDELKVIVNSEKIDLPRGESIEIDNGEYKPLQNGVDRVEGRVEIFKLLNRQMRQIGRGIRTSLQNIKEVADENKLRQVYNKNIEIYRLKDGRELRGVVVSQQQGKLILQTAESIHVLDEDEIIIARFIRGERGSQE